MLTIASDHEFDERNQKIRTSPTPLPGASNFPSVRKSTEVTLILHQQRRFVRGQSTHLRSDGLIKKKRVSRRWYGDPIFSYSTITGYGPRSKYLPFLHCCTPEDVVAFYIMHSVVLSTPYDPPTCEDR